jgi:hypothetical protein
MMNSDIKAMLLHLGYNMWSKCDSELRLKDEFWRKATDCMAAAKYNTLLVDVGEGLVFPSHPELAIKGSWTPDKMRSEIDRLKAKGLTLVPKLNFSGTHDRWLGEYARMVSTSEYYRVVADVIRDTAEIFGNPGLFHLGWDEETYSHQSKHDYVVVRQRDLWWKDFLYTVKCVEDTGNRAWVWSDYGWHHDDYVKRCPKSVMQSNWYYRQWFNLEKIPAARRIHLESFLFLEKAGFDQIPCGSNWACDENISGLVKFCRKNIAPERLKGFLMTAWEPTLPGSEPKLMKSLELAAAAYGQ